MEGGARCCPPPTRPAPARRRCEGSAAALCNPPRSRRSPPARALEVRSGREAESVWAAAPAGAPQLLGLRPFSRRSQAAPEPSLGAVSLPRFCTGCNLLRGVFGSLKRYLRVFVVFLSSYYWIDFLCALFRTHRAYSPNNSMTLIVLLSTYSDTYLLYTKYFVSSADNLVFLPFCTMTTQCRC